MIECPVCGLSAAEFLPLGNRKNAKCPGCGSLERHRLLWLYFQRRTNLFKAPLRVLHFSPRACFRDRFRALKNLDYNTADVHEGCDFCFDIQNIPDHVGAFDVILAVHVLEHVLDDRRAMRELRRALKPGGWAVLQAPILREITFEDPTIETPEDRLMHYGHPEHLRAYGKDYFERLLESGFRVDALHAGAFLTPGEIKQHRTSFENIYLCKKGNSD